MIRYITNAPAISSAGCIFPGWQLLQIEIKRLRMTVYTPSSGRRITSASTFSTMVLYAKVFLHVILHPFSKRPVEGLDRFRLTLYKVQSAPLFARIPRPILGGVPGAVHAEVQLSHEVTLSFVFLWEFHEHLPSRWCTKEGSADIILFSFVATGQHGHQHFQGFKWWSRCKQFWTIVKLDSGAPHIPPAVTFLGFLVSLLFLYLSLCIFV